MTASLRTFFVRHTRKLDIDQATRDWLWKNGHIAVHYPFDDKGDSNQDSESLNPEDYSGRAKSAIWYINTLASSGGYVCADYFGHADVLVGKVQPRSKVEIHRGKWGDLIGMPGREAVLKTVKLSCIQEISPASCAPIMAARPRQGTIMYWHKAGSAIQRIVERESHEIALADLSPDHQEVLCSEYLRQEYLPLSLPRLSKLLLPIGRTMKDLDILGLSCDGERICAQVTFSPLSSIEGKMKKLLEYSGERTVLIMFCDDDARSEVNGVHIVPLRMVFDWMQNSSWVNDWTKLNFEATGYARDA